MRAAFFGLHAMTLTYDDSRAHSRANECLRLDSMHVRWASGVVASAPDLKACPSRDSRSSSCSNRPDLPGAELDTNYAAQLERNPALQKRPADTMRPSSPRTFKVQKAN